MKHRFTLLLTTCLCLLTSCNSAEINLEKHDPNDSKYYIVGFMTIKDMHKFMDYAKKIGPFIQKYGGTLQHQFTPSQVYGADKPSAVNLAVYPNKEAYHKFLNDPEFKKFDELGKSAYDVKAVGGYSLGSNLEDKSTTGNREYMIEIAKFRDSEGKSYKNWLSDAKSKMEPFGYHIERMIKPIETYGNFDKPDIITISYFSSKSDSEKWEKSKDHKSIEGSYSTATSSSIWVMGKTRF